MDGDGVDVCTKLEVKLKSHRIVRTERLTPELAIALLVEPTDSHCCLGLRPECWAPSLLRSRNIVNVQRIQLP